MTQANPFQPVLTGVEQVEAAVAWFAEREGLPSGFANEVRGEMRRIRSEARSAASRVAALHPVEQPLVQRLADALNELAGNLTIAQRGGAGTDVGPEQTFALMEEVRSAIRTFQTVTRG